MHERRYVKRSSIMENHSTARVVLMLFGFLNILVAMMFNLLSRFGSKSGIFRQKTEDVTLKYTTPITPSLWTYFVWDFNYIWLLAMFIYFLVALCRRNAYAWMYTTPAALPYGFHISVMISISMNTIWLFLFDRELLLPAFITSALMTILDYVSLFFSCHGLKIYGAWLNKHHTTDLWLIRVLVQNGIAVCATWGTLSTLLELTVFLHHQTEETYFNCAMLSQLLLVMELFAWFLLENFYLDEHVRYILSIYPVVILWLTGTLTNAGPPGGHVYIFSALILALSCVMFVARIALVTWRHRKRPLYNDNEPSWSPVEIALTQRKIFL